jgi:hypothetical protein
MFKVKSRRDCDNIIVLPPSLFLVTGNRVQKSYKSFKCNYDTDCIEEKSFFFNQKQETS